MSVRLVLTEHPSHLTDERPGDYERVRQQLEAACGEPVQTCHYLDMGAPGGASALVLSGSYAPWSAHDAAALDRLGEVVRTYEGPVFGICAGMQLLARFGGGGVVSVREAPLVGFRAVEVVEPDGLFAGLPARVEVFEHHTDEVAALPAGFRVLARSAECAVEALAAPERRWWGTQFHPEDWDDRHPAGEIVLRNFFALARGAR